MTTIFLVAIGVLIAAAAALMMFFYGGDAFAVNKTRADAARLVMEGQNIAYATDFYYRQEGVLPGNGTDGTQAVKDLLAKNYLQSVPVGYLDGTGTQQDWKLEYGTDGMIYTHVGTSTDKASLALCSEARRQLAFADYKTVYQCNGSDYPRNHPDGTLPDREPCCIR